MCWPQYKIAVEVDGAVFTRGRHTRGMGFINDCMKTNEAARLGYKVFRFPSQYVLNGFAAKFITQIFKEIPSECDH